MSKIQINLELDSNKPNELKIVAKMLLELAGAPTISEAPQAASDQQWAEEVNESLKEEAAEAAPKKRGSKAKPKTEETPASEAASEAASEQDVDASDQETSSAENIFAKKNAGKKAAAEEAEEPKAEEGIKLDDLRASLSLKVKSHRDEIKTKLTELGASNLTTLDAGNYAAMNDFLKGLK